MPIPINPFLSILGANVHRRNRDAEREQYRARMERNAKAKAPEARKIAKAKTAFGG